MKKIFCPGDEIGLTHEKNAVSSAGGGNMLFVPIQLTPDGDALELPEQIKIRNEYTEREESPVIPENLESLKLGEYPCFVSVPVADQSGRSSHHRTESILGQHQFCGGFLKLAKISTWNNAISCPNCGLRVVVPGLLETYGDLRRYAKENLCGPAPRPWQRKASSQ